jgi:pimeloyl-ACP methyl ester carboxylesterase
MGRFSPIFMLLWALATPFAAVAAPPPISSAAAEAEGDWVGVLATGAAQLHLAFHIHRTAGVLSGTMDSIDQGATGIPLASIRAEGGKLSFETPSIGGRYAGTSDAAQGRYVGEWNQQTVRLPLTLARGTVAARPVIAGLDGDWDGKLDLGAMGPLRIVFHIRTTPVGTIATLESPDQGPGELPFASIARDAGRVALDAPAIAARFEGEVSVDGGTISGRWRQNGQESALVVKRRAAGARRPAALNRPQMPKRPFPYREIEVGFDNPAGHNHLAGTLTVPPGKGPFPAALLITGSGLQDRDETLMGHKPFLVLSDYLTRRGIAILRVDDRSIGGSTGDVVHATSADFATDVEAGVTFLASRSEIDPRRIGLIGHSEGGLIAPMVAARDPKVAWIVMMAGPGIPGDQIILAQQRLIAAAAGVPAADLDKNEAVERRLLQAVEQAPDAVSAREAAKAILVQNGMADARGDAAAASLSSDWYRAFLRSDPASALRQLRIPVLAVAGSLDLQVPPAESMPAIRAALARDPNASVVELPGLNHLFQTARTGAVSEYQQIEETIAPVALKTIGDWIVAHTH